MKKTCVVTGTRAEYGLLRPVMDGINASTKLELQVIVTGMHLSAEFGMTYRDIEEDGFQIDKKIEILLSSDSPVGIGKSTGLGVIGFAEALESLQPDLLLVLGDRFDIFAAVTAASIARVPVVHLHGGETTEGAIDESFRHSITKMSHLHFAATEEYQRRIIQLGEHPNRVFNVGALGVENIRNLQLLDKTELEKEIDFKLGERYFLVTFHPVTLEFATAKNQFKELLAALKKTIDADKRFKILFTKANADTDGRIINRLIDEFSADFPDNCKAFKSMGHLKYLSAMKNTAVVIGNSSSGIIEAPSFKVPTVNIGDRQKGRVRADSVIECEPNSDSIENSINKAISAEFVKTLRNLSNPYEQSNTSTRIVEVIEKADLSNIIKKQFYNFKT